MYTEPPAEDIAALIAGLGVLFAVYGVFIGLMLLVTLVVPAVICFLLAKAKGYDPMVAALCGFFLYPYSIFYYVGIPLRRDDLRFPENRH